MSSDRYPSIIKILNDRLRALGTVCGGAMPRFAWKYAPDELWVTYGQDGRTTRQRSWADMANPGGGTLGKVWLLAEWRQTKSTDHHGYGEGTRVARAQDFAYHPYIETALAPEKEPTEDLTANYLQVMRRQMETTLDIHIANAKWDTDQQTERDRIDHYNRTAAEYDKYEGAFHNLEPGKRDGYLSLPSTSKEILPGMGFDGWD